VIPSRPILAAAVTALRDIEWRGSERTPALTSEIRVVALELSNERTKRNDELQQDRIDLKH
jgi:hypothetical protein